MSQPFEIELPYPPSANHYFVYVIRRRKTGGSYATRILGAKGAAYRNALRRAVFQQAMARSRHVTSDGRLKVLIEAWAPDRRLRDVDNLTKALLDACTEARLWNDDAQIKDLRIIWRGVEPGGRVKMTIDSLESTLFN